MVTTALKIIYYYSECLFSSRKDVANVYVV
jgi:hypothetical protein